VVNDDMIPSTYSIAVLSVWCMFCGEEGTGSNYAWTRREWFSYRYNFIIDMSMMMMMMVCHPWMTQVNVMPIIQWRSGRKWYEEGRIRVAYDVFDVVFDVVVGYKW